jgi:surfactin synthase thioesterase subunit
MKSYPEKINLFMFPYAGGNKYAFNGYTAHMPQGIRMVAVEPPGRGARVREPLLTSLDEMAHDIFEKNKAAFSGDYAFFGHSMGSWLAYLVTQLIRKEGLPLPMHLFFSGSGNPAYYRPKVINHQLGREAFFKHLTDLGGLSEAIAGNDAMLNFFEPILRADFKAVETYKHTPYPPLPIPITSMIGSHEKNVTYEMATAWGHETNEGCEVLVFEGNHFFINKHNAEIASIIADRLQCRKTSQATENFVSLGRAMPYNI